MEVCAHEGATSTAMRSADSGCQSVTMERLPIASTLPSSLYAAAVIGRSAQQLTHMSAACCLTLT